MKMSDDWVSRYVTGVHNPRQQERQDAKGRRRLAETRAPEMFKQIQDRIAQDVHMLCSVPAFQLLKVGYPGGAPGGFQVIHPSAPWVTLDVTREGILISYKYTFKPKNGQGRSGEEPGTLRICSDLDAHLTVYRNGDGGAFTDVSEVSEFLLRPMLDHIDVE
jgi:hypothetical protein